MLYDVTVSNKDRLSAFRILSLAADSVRGKSTSCRTPKGFPVQKESADLREPAWVWLQNREWWCLELECVFREFWVSGRPVETASHVDREGLVTLLRFVELDQEGYATRFLPPGSGVVQTHREGVWLTVERAAEETGLTVKTLWEYLRRDKIKGARKVGCRWWIPYEWTQTRRSRSSSA